MALPGPGVSARLLEAWRPQERLSPSQWAQRYLHIPAKEASVLGTKYSLEHTPYMQGPIDALVEPGVFTVNVVSSARIGKTAGLAAWMGYTIDCDPGPWLQMYPVEDLAKRRCGKTADVIEATPRLSRHIIDAGWNTKDTLRLRDMEIEYGWAGSTSKLIDRGVKVMGYDEVDNCEKRSGSLGNTLKVAQERVRSFGPKGRCAAISTPTSPEGSAWKTWEKSDQRRYWVPCPKCGAYQVLAFSRIKAEDAKGERVTDPVRIELESLGYYECEHCEAHLKAKKHLRFMVDRGVWLPAGVTPLEKLPLRSKKKVAAAKFDPAGDPKDRWTPKTEGAAKRSLIAGFHIWRAYAPNSWTRNGDQWSEILAEFFSAKQSGDPEELRVFFNACLGEPFSDTVEEVKVGTIRHKRSLGLPEEIVPREAKVLLGGADVQKDCLYYVIRAFGYYGRSWKIKSGMVWELEDLLEVMTRRFDREGETPGEIAGTMSVRRCAVDSGYRTDEVYGFCDAHAGFRAVKGESTFATWRTRPSQPDYTPKNARTSRKAKLLLVNTGVFKERIYKGMRVGPGEPGEWNIDRHSTDDYCDQVTSEIQVWEKRKKAGREEPVAVWKKRTSGAANHFLDAEVYAMALAHQMGATSLRPTSPSSATETSPEKKTFGRGTMGYKTRSLTRTS